MVSIFDIDIFSLNSFFPELAWGLTPKHFFLNGKNFVIDKELKTIQAENSNYISVLAINDLIIINNEFILVVKAIIDDFIFEVNEEINFTEIKKIEKINLDLLDETKNLIQYKNKILNYCKEKLENSKFYDWTKLNFENQNKFNRALIEFCFFTFKSLKENNFEKKDSLENVKKYRLGDMEYEFFDKQFSNLSDINKFPLSVQELLIDFLPSKVISMTKKYD